MGFFKKMVAISIGFVLLSSLVLLPSESHAESIWATYANAEEARKDGNYETALSHYKIVLPYFIENESDTNIATIHNRMAQVKVPLSLYEQAVEKWDQASIYYERSGRIQESTTTTRNADSIRSTVKVFSKVNSHAVADQYYHGAKFESKVGALLGAYAEQDPAAHNASTGSPFYTEEFPNLTGKKHAAYLLYVSWGTDVSRLASHIRRAEEQGVALQLALQPNNGLSEIVDDSYLRQFARDLNDTGIPVFLRFANEMNGDWVNWFDDADTYIEKFRTVSDVFNEETDNVAMVWAPNYFPMDNIESYYPGDQYVDWVGVSMYQRHNTDRDPLGKGIDRSSYVEKFDHIYHLYADKKPIFISEGAVSYIDTNTKQIVEDYAVRHIETFYSSLPMLYPRLKGVYWFSSDGQSANDYRLSQNEKVLNAYKKAIQNPFYLSNVGDESPVSYLSVNDAGVPPREAELHAYVNTIDPNTSKVAYYINGSHAGTSYSPSWSVTYNFLPYRSQTVDLEVRVYGEDGSRVATHEQKLRVGSANIELNQSPIDFDTQIKIQNNRMFAPVRQIAEAAEADVSWNGSTRSLTIEHSQGVLEMTIGSKSATQNGESVTLDAAPFIENSRTYLPMRFIIEDGLNYKMDWNDTTFTTSFEID